MLIDTHCHINIMVKEKFDVPLKPNHFDLAATIVKQAAHDDVTHIINVGTSKLESKNCVELAQKFEHVWATVGIHPNDCTQYWQDDLKELKKLIQKNPDKIIGIGECGIDKHYEEYDLARQQDAFKAQIELALEHNLALVVHSRDAADETLGILDGYVGDLKRCVMHCFSYGKAIADDVQGMGFALGIGGTVTYPKNETLRAIVKNINLEHIVLETDAPYLPPQIMRGKVNHPQQIKTIAQYISELRGESFEKVAQQTTANAFKIFGI